MRLAAMIAVLVCLGGWGCASSSSHLTKTQLDALQVRQVEASPDRAFAAATNAVIDAGFTVEVTDGDAGLLTAVRREDPSVVEHAAILTLTTVLTLGHYPSLAPSRLYAVGVQVLPRPGGLALVRIRPYGHSDLGTDQREITQLWTLMQRQVLIRDPVEEPRPAVH
jgi:hypothetical protein